MTSTGIPCIHDRKGMDLLKRERLPMAANKGHMMDTKKLDGSTPTVITESIFLTGVIDAKEGRAMIMVDVGSTFLNTDNYEQILMLLRGKLAETIVTIVPAFFPVIKERYPYDICPFDKSSMRDT